MLTEGGKDGLLLEIVNKQFEMIGEKVRFEDIPDDGIVTIDGKKKKWYDVYKFTEDEEKEWREWSMKKLGILGQENARKIMDYAELRYGFCIRYKKKGELF